MQRFKNILCVVNAERSTNMALTHAAKLAVNNQASLTVVEVIDEIPPNTKPLDRILSSDDLQAIIAERHRARLEEMIALCDKDIEIQIKVLSGIPFFEVIKEVLRNDRDLVIKTADSGVLLGRIFSSDDMHLLRKCPCPVWLVKSNAPMTHRRILATVDVDSCSPSETLNSKHLLNLQVLELASSLALSDSSELYVAHVWNAFGEGAMRDGLIQRPKDEVDAYVEEVRQQHLQNLNEVMNEMNSKLGPDAVEYLKPQIYLLKGSPRTEIPVFANEVDADLVVMGTVARTGLAGVVMGNTAEAILNQLDCSILAIKPTGFVTPVTLED